jgi:plastocyanin
MGGLFARRGSVAIGVALAMGMGATGCAESSLGPALGPPVVPTIAPVQSGEVRVSARDNDFVTNQITVEVGSVVVWKNDGRTNHNIVAEDGTFKVEAAAFLPKAEYRYTFTKAGTFPYFCSIHGTKTVGMIGVVQVIAPEKVGSQL